MPIDYKKYPKNWKTEIRPKILERAGNKCEGSPKYPECRAEDRSPHPVTGSKVILTIAHLNHDTKDSRPENLRAWCQRCHNTYDAPYRAKNRRENKGS